MKKLFITISAVPLKVARPYVKSFDRTRYAEIFNKYGTGKSGEKYRIYIPVSDGLPVTLI